MHRILIAMTLATAACAPRAQPAAQPTRGHMASTNAPTARRITHPESDVTCEDEAPAGTLIERRKCRSNAEREQDRRFVQDSMLDPSARPSCDPTQQPDGVCHRDPGVTQQLHPKH